MLERRGVVLHKEGRKNCSLKRGLRVVDIYNGDREAVICTREERNVNLYLTRARNQNFIKSMTGASGHRYSGIVDGLMIKGPYVHAREKDRIIVRIRFTPPTVGPSSYWYNKARSRG